MAGERLYQPPRQPIHQPIHQPDAIADRTLEIPFRDPGMRAYSFAFG